MKVDKSGWKRMKGNESGWKQMKANESWWKWIKVDESMGQPWPAVIGGCKWWQMFILFFPLSPLPPPCSHPHNADCFFIDLHFAHFLLGIIPFLPEWIYLGGNKLKLCSFSEDHHRQSRFKGKGQTDRICQFSTVIHPRKNSLSISDMD